MQPPSLKKRIWAGTHRSLALATYDGVGAGPVILKSETYNFHRLDLTRQVGFVVTIYDEDGLRLAATMPCATPAEAFATARKIADGKVEGPRK